MLCQLDFYKVDGEYALQIRPCHTGQHENRYHQDNERAGTDTNRHTRSTQMPRTLPESVTNEEYSNEDRRGESNEGRNGGDREQSSGRQSSAKYQKCHADTDRNIKPNSIDRCLGMSVDALYPEGARKAIISGVSICDTGSGHLVRHLSGI